MTAESYSFCRRSRSLSGGFRAWKNRLRTSNISIFRFTKFTNLFIKVSLLIKRKTRGNNDFWHFDPQKELWEAKQTTGDLPVPEVRATTSA